MIALVLLVIAIAAAIYVYKHPALVDALKARIGIKPAAPANVAPAATNVAPAPTPTAPTPPKPSITDILFPATQPSGTLTPSGTLNLAPVWDKFDGHNSPQTLGPGKSVTATVTLPVNARFSLICSQTVGTQPATVSATVTKNGEAYTPELWNGPPDPKVTCQGNAGDKFSITLTTDRDTVYRLTLQNLGA